MIQTPITISQLPDLGSVQGSDRLVLDRIGAAVTAGAFVVGQAYQIISVGNTSFTAIGAESNTVGAYFVATGAGTGTGTAGPINTADAPVSALAALLGGDPAGTAAAAVAAHAAAADPHPGYTTPQEAAAAAPVQSVALSAPSGWSTSTTNTGGSVTLTLGLPSGFSLPSNAIQATWTAGAALAGTAVQEGDIRLTDSREWIAATVSQAAAEAGTSTARVAYNPLRMFQGIAAWWAASEFKAKLDGLATVATSGAYGDLSGRPTLGSAAATPATDYAPAAQGVAGGNSHNHDGGDGAPIAYASLSGLPSIPSPADAAPAALAATAAIGTSTDYAREDHVHQRDPELLVVELSGTQADPTAATAVERFRFPWPAQILASALSAETAASGSAFIVNARLNATSIYSALPQIAIGSTEGSSSTLSITTAAAGDILRFDITQAGGGCRLAQLYLTVRRTG
jgi:hypothetical protein